MKDELIEKMNTNSSIRHNPGYEEREKEKIREELFEGDHHYPFL